MINEKQEQTIVNTLNDVVMEDKIYKLLLQSKLKKSKDDIKNGRIMTIEESKERMRKKYKSFNVK